MSHVTVSRDWGEEGKGMTCDGFSGLDGRRGEVSHVTASRIWMGGGKTPPWTLGIAT